MSKGGQVVVLDSKQWAKLEAVASSLLHKTIWAVLRFTGCRSQEARLLMVENCYADPVNRIVRNEIFFPAQIRKGKLHSLSVPTCAKLRSYLERYKAPIEGYLFPSPRNLGKPLSYEAIYKYLKESAINAGMAHDKVATHCGRRSLVTALANQGVNPRIIQKITGHQSLNTLQRYIEVTNVQKLTALENVSL